MFRGYGDGQRVGLTFVACERTKCFPNFASPSDHMTNAEIPLREFERSSDSRCTVLIAETSAVEGEVTLGRRVRRAEVRNEIEEQEPDVGTAEVFGCRNAFCVPAPPRISGVNQRKNIERRASLDRSLPGNDRVPVVPDQDDQSLRGRPHSGVQSTIRPWADPKAVAAPVLACQVSEGLSVLIRA